MKKFIIVSSILISLLLHSTNLKATHFAGADLTYTCLSGNTYKITLAFYRDCSGVMEPPSVLINASCGSNSNLDFDIILNNLSNSGVEITQSCNSQITSCTGGIGHPYGLKEYIYETTIVLPPCADWVLCWTGASRSYSSTTSAGSTAWYVPITINNLQVPSNSAPIYNNKIIPLTPINSLATLDYGGIDADGDSLAYSFYAPMLTGPTNTVAYIYSFNQNNFLQSSTPITINPNTGVINCTPSAILSSMLGVKIEQWANVSGNMILAGTTYRDLTLYVYNTTNNIPIVSGMDFTNSHTFDVNDTVFHKSICAFQAVEFDINGFDLDTGNRGVFNINWDSGISNASFTPYFNGTDSAYAHFSWVPTNADTASQHSFKVIIQDSACTYFGENTKQYYIDIMTASTETVSLDVNNVSICSDSTITISATSSVSNPVYSWFWNNLPITNTNSTFTYIGSNYIPSIDTISVRIPSQYTNCPTQDMTIIDLIYQPIINNTFPDTGFCTNDSITIDAGQGGVYLWKDGFGNTIGDSQLQTFYQTGMYNLYVNGKTNSQCFDNDTLAILVSPSPPNINLGQDMGLQMYDSITFSAPVGFSYLWSTGETTQEITIYGHELGSTGMHSVWVSVSNMFCTISDTIQIYNYVSINPANTYTFVDITPNPNNGNFTLKIKNENSNYLNLSIYNSIGKEVHKENLEFQNSIVKKLHLEHLPKGIYFIYLKKENNIVWSHKIIIL